MARREAVAAMRLLARALVLRRAPASEWSPDDRITLDAFLRTPTGRRFYDSLALLAVTAALRGVEERPFVTWTSTCRSSLTGSTTTG